MTAENETNDDGLKAEVGAVAKAEASAKYERKTVVTIDVPADVTRQKSQAFLDLVSPFTQSAGLLGDYLAEKRENLRLRRIETLNKIAAKAYNNILGQEERVKPIPVKGLIPILEASALEDPDDDILIERWASLMSSASLTYDSEITTFTRILSEIGHRECVILDRIFANSWTWVDGSQNPKAMIPFYDSASSIKPLIRSAIKNNDQNIFPKLREYVDSSMPMNFTLVASRATTRTSVWIDQTLKETVYSENENSYRLLEAQGLIVSSGHSYDWQTGEIPVAVDWVSLTALGGRFMSRVIPRPAGVTKES